MRKIIEIRIGIDEEDARAGFLHRVADLEVWCDRPLDSSAIDAPAPAPAAGTAEPVWSPVYDGPGLVGGRIERVASFKGASGALRFDYADGERYEISADGGSIRRAAAGSSPWSEERILGAPLALALARRGIHLLHAAAVADARGRVVALLAESGGGKSTLAAAAERAASGLSRVADDQLPVRLGLSPVALSRFPQLKLGPHESAPEQLPDSSPLLALVELAPTPGIDRPLLTRLSDSSAAEALVRSTVAARLFDRQLLDAHFDACADAAAAVAAYRFAYPWGLDRLGEAVRELATRLSGE